MRFEATQCRVNRPGCRISILDVETAAGTSRGLAGAGSSRVRGRLRGYRKDDRKRAPAARPGALRPDRAAVRLDEVPGDRESDPASAAGPRPGPIYPIEPVE